MRLGGPLFGKYDDPAGWAAAVKAKGYSAAYCPVDTDASEEMIRAYASAAEDEDIVIAEVGAWSNPLSPDSEERASALEKCRKSLALADAIGARCCVNVAGSRGEKWCGPCADDLTRETFDMIVETVRGIIDDVQPTRSFYTLETMPWMYPDSADSYVSLVEAVDRLAFAVHFDPVNLICSPERYFRSGDIVRDFMSKLGGRIRSCHAKDILLREGLTVHLDEVRPGAGRLDYRTFLRSIAELSTEIPVMLEHLSGEDEYDTAAAYIRGILAEEGLSSSGS